MHPIRANARVLMASCVGTAVEYYDFFIYGTAAALVFGPLFFPASSPAAQTLLAFMSFGIAFGARPLGAMVFGHFGDRIGRKSTLVASLMLMGASTVAIALLPTYAQAGWIAPMLLCVMRFGQGFGLGGEWSGAALLAIENAPKGWETRFVSIMQMGSPIGFIAANGVFLLLGLWLDPADFMAWGWRVPFLASAVLVGLGLWVRLKIGETAAFREALEREPPAAVPLVEVLALHPGGVLAGAAGVICTFAVFYLSTAFALAQATGPLGFDKTAFLTVQLFSAVCYAVAILIAGAIADRTSSGKVVGASALATILVGLVFSAGLSSGSMAIAGATICGAMFVLGFNNGPLGSWLSTLFPVRLRYSGVAFAFNVGGIIGGALTPIAAQAMVAAGASAYVGLLLSLAGLLTFIGVIAARGRGLKPGLRNPVVEDAHRPAFQVARAADEPVGIGALDLDIE